MGRKEKARKKCKKRIKNENTYKNKTYAYYIKYWFQYTKGEMGNKRVGVRVVKKRKRQGSVNGMGLGVVEGVGYKWVRGKRHHGMERKGIDYHCL